MQALEAQFPFRVYLDGIIPSISHFLKDFSFCPDLAFITTCNYLRLIRFLLRQRPIAEEAHLSPLYFDINIGIDSRAMIRLMIRATLLPSFCMEVLEDMRDTRFTRCNHPFLSTTPLRERADLKDFMQSRAFFASCLRPPRED